MSYAAVRPGAESGEDALAQGVLLADNATGCLWLKGDDGRAAQQLLLQGDYKVVFEDNPVTVRRGGEVVAQVGQRVEVAGGNASTTQGVAGGPAGAGVWLRRFE